VKKREKRAKHFTFSPRCSDAALLASTKTRRIDDAARIWIFVAVACFERASENNETKQDLWLTPCLKWSLVNLEKELQSSYMSIKLYQFGLAWNFSNNSKSMKNQKKLQLQKLFQITSSFSTNYLAIFHTLSYFFLWVIRFWQLFLSWKINYSAAHLSVAASSARAHLSEVAGHVVHHTLTGLPVLHAFKGADILTKSV
jgi:hypothetical protein